MKKSLIETRFATIVGSTLGQRHDSIACCCSPELRPIAQSLQTVNMAIPAKSFQMVIYPDRAAKRLHEGRRASING